MNERATHTSNNVSHPCKTTKVQFVSIGPTLKTNESRCGKNGPTQFPPRSSSTIIEAGSMYRHWLTLADANFFSRSSRALVRPGDNSVRRGEGVGKLTSNQYPIVFESLVATSDQNPTSPSKAISHDPGNSVVGRIIKPSFVVPCRRK